MCLKPEGMKKLYFPDFVLGESKICRVESEIYLGYNLMNMHLTMTYCQRNEKRAHMG